MHFVKTTIQMTVPLKMRNFGSSTCTEMKVSNVTFVKKWNIGEVNISLRFNSVKVRENVCLKVHAGLGMKSLIDQIINEKPDGKKKLDIINKYLWDYVSFELTLGIKDGASLGIKVSSDLKKIIEVL